MEKFNLITNSAVELGDDLAAESNGKGRKFVSRFIEAGVAHYEQFGDVLITKETLDKFINTMVGCPVIIKHKDITDKNADKERVGVVSDVWFNQGDGWYYCSGIIWDKQAIDLVKNQDWNVSCTYDFESDKEAKTHNGKKIDMEFTGGNFLHLALVDNPRYERANIVMNAKAENESGHWVTVKPNGEENKGRHLFIKDGEDIGDAMRRQWGVDVKGQQHLFDRKKYKTDTNYKEELNKKLQEHLKTVQKRYDNLEYLGTANPEDYSEEDYEDISFEEWESKQEDKKETPKDSYYEPDMEETYTKSYEENIQKDYDEFMKAQKENKQTQKDDDLEKHLYKELSEKDKKADEKKYEQKQKLRDYYYNNPQELTKEKAQEHWDKDKIDLFDLHEELSKKKEPDSPFGEGVEIKEHDKKGYMLDSKNLKSYSKGEKFAVVDDWSHDDKERFTVHFHDGKKRLSSKTYSTKRGMEKAIRDHLQGGDNKETKALAVKTDLEAAKTRYKDVLSKYNEADRKRWQSGISPQEYHQAWVDAEKYKKELTGARREYAESIMSNFEAVENNPYEQRIEDKKMRYSEMAAKTQAESDRVAKQSHDMISAIPMGQPILVGHHSEKRDRAYRQRAWDKMDKAYQLSKKADYYADKASSVGTAGISSDDANAIAKLAQKYKSGVDSAEKRRIIDRVIDIHSRATSTKPASEQTDYGFSIERNKDLNRLQLKFDDIPDANTRAILKSNGFRWSPREKAWQRQLNGNSEHSLKSVMEKMKAENALLEGIEDILEEHNISQEDLPILEGLYNILKD